jgi:ABC-type multidrug transport system ATPase subunit
MSLHTPDDALGLADRMLFIAEGRIQLNETPERVLRSGASEIRRFLGR